MKLADQNCIPCQGTTPPLDLEVSTKLMQELPKWELVENHHLVRTYSFKDFREALAFTNQVGELAEAQNHHPEIRLSYGEVEIKIWTHKINGLAESDFVFAAKCDAL